MINAVAQDRVVTVRMPPLHAGQRAVLRDPARFKVVACGRRWGKTRLGAALSLSCALAGGAAYWVAPTYDMARHGFEVIKRLARHVPNATFNESLFRVAFAGGGYVRARSADNPDGLRGAGLDYVVLDEAAYMRRETWSDVLRPTLADRQGSAMFISTPAGRNWFWNLYQQAASADGWARWNIPTAGHHLSNPLPGLAGEMEAARTEQPERVWRQEWLAEFVDDQGSVFRNVRACVVDDHVVFGQLDGKTYTYMGIDWGRDNDYTVIAVVADDGTLLELDRFNQIDYDVQLGRVRAAVERWRPERILAEENAMGAPMVTFMRQMGINVTPFQTTASSKPRLIDALALAVEQVELRIPASIDNADVIIDEMQSYEQTRSTSGAWKFAAPAGAHDDAVIALALAWSARAAVGGVLFSV